MTTAERRARFWDARVLQWEAARYEGAWSPRLGPGELLARLLPQPTRERQRLAASLLAPHVKGRSVVELGCGTGRLANQLLAAGGRLGRHLHRDDQVS